MSGIRSNLFILLCTLRCIVLNTLVYIAIVIIVIIIIVVLLRFLFNVLFLMPVTSEQEYFIKYTTVFLPPNLQ